jgi:hypothetical protein
MSLLLRTTSAEQADGSPWEDYGLLDNPFRPAGFGVEYEAHITAEVERLRTWLTDAVTKPRTRPLAIKGSIGIGKTHLLKRVEADLGTYATASGERVAGTYVTVTGAGARSLQLGTLLLEALRSSLPWQPRGDSEMPFVDALLAAKLPAGDIPGVSGAVANALTRARAEKEGGRAFKNWLAQRELSRKEQELLGVSGRLHGEGEAVRVFADLTRIGAKALKFRSWVLLIDQVEDLWRRDEVTPVKRARFLTDLRALVDEGLTGAPVALLVAWNTEVGRALVDGLLKQDYAALWSRFGDPIDLPRLGGEHAEPFAQAYIDAEHARFQARKHSQHNPSNALRAALHAATPKLVAAARAKEGSLATGLIPRLWLDQLREWGDTWIKAQIPARPRKR